MFHQGFRPARPSRRTSLDRPTYRYQARPQRQVWRAPVPWQGTYGLYLAIRRELDGEYSVAVLGTPIRWLPVQRALSETELREWLRRCGLR